MKKISIIIPAYNEEESLPILYERLSKLMENMKEDDISISTICDYVTLMETDKIYCGYRTIYVNAP